MIKYLIFVCNHLEMCDKYSIVFTAYEPFVIYDK